MAVEEIAAPLIKPIFENVKCHVCRMIQHKQKIQQLRRQLTKLGEIKEIIQERVRGAKDNGRDIAPNYRRWLETAEDKERAIQILILEHENEAHQECCLCIPNLLWCHKMGTEADKKKRDVINLIKDGGELQQFPVALYSPFQCEVQFGFPDYYIKFKSRDSVSDLIMEALKDSTVSTFGVHGPGGVGKMTTAKGVAKEAEELGVFYTIIKADVSNDPDIIEIQDALAAQLNLTYEKQGRVGRADELRRRLNRNKKTLVVLGKVWKEVDLNAIGIPTSSGGAGGCKVLLISQNKDVFKRMNVQRHFSIGYLEESEAEELFKKVVGESVINSKAKEVCKKLGGLPSAIVAVGTAVKNEESGELDYAVERVKSSLFKYIDENMPVDCTSLKLSYDFLKHEDAKPIFLHCCLFPQEAEISIEDLARHISSLRLFKKVDSPEQGRIKVQAMVNLLKKCYLLQNGIGPNFIKMHAVIHSLAVSIAEEKQIVVDHDIREWPENDAWKHRTAISLRIKNKIADPPVELHCPKAHTLVLDSRNSELKLPNGFLEGMKGVRVLHLTGVRMESLPALDNVRMLHLKNCILVDPATIRCLKDHLETLVFQGLNIEELPQEIGKLTRLCLLDVSGTRLKGIPDGLISKLEFLEELHVTHRFVQWDPTTAGREISNGSIDELKLRNELGVSRVPIGKQSVRKLQERLRSAGKFIMYEISVNSKFVRESRTEMLKLEKNISIDEFIVVLDIYEGLELTDISGSEKGVSDDKDGMGFEDSEFLQVDNRKDFENLLIKPKEFTQSCGLHSSSRSFNKLTIYEVIQCNSMEEYVLPASCSIAIQQIRELIVEDHSIMEKIIGVGREIDEEDLLGHGESIDFNPFRFVNLEDPPQSGSFYHEMERAPMEGNSSTAAESIFNPVVSSPTFQTLVT